MLRWLNSDPFPFLFATKTSSGSKLLNKSADCVDKRIWESKDAWRTISEKTFTALIGEKGYTIIDIQFENNASSEDVKAIENLFTDGGVIFSDSLSKVQQQRNLYHTFAVLVYGFLSIIVAITIFHIMNTINMGVAAKMKEYGGMRYFPFGGLGACKTVTKNVCH